MEEESSSDEEEEVSFLSGSCLQSTHRLSAAFSFVRLIAPWLISVFVSIQAPKPAAKAAKAAPAKAAAKKAAPVESSEEESSDEVTGFSKHYNT